MNHADMAQIRDALAELPARCRYHGAQITGDDPRRYGGACCATGEPALRRREAEFALNRAAVGGYGSHAVKESTA